MRIDGILALFRIFERDFADFGSSQKVMETLEKIRDQNPDQDISFEKFANLLRQASPQHFNNISGDISIDLMAYILF